MNFLVGLGTSLILCYFINIIVFYIFNHNPDDDIIAEKLGISFLCSIINTPLCMFLSPYQNFARSQLKSIGYLLFNSLGSIGSKILNVEFSGGTLNKILVVLLIILTIYCSTISICGVISIFECKLTNHSRRCITLDLSVTFFSFSLLLLAIIISHKINILLILVTLCFIPIFKRKYISSSIFASINICIFLLSHAIILITSFKKISDETALTASASIIFLVIPILRFKFDDLFDEIFGGRKFIPQPNLPRNYYYDENDDLETRLAEMNRAFSHIKGTATTLPNGEPGIINRNRSVYGKGVIEDLNGNMIDIIDDENEYGIRGRSGCCYNNVNNN